jgi:Bacteriophage probable baseplate hub protein
MSTALTYPVRAPDWRLFYRGANITARIERMVTSITYSDAGTDFSDEIAVALEDREKKWQGPWYPAEGDLVHLLIGYHGEPLMDCGEFQVHRIELAGPPDVMNLRCLAAHITPAMRTPNTAGYENQTLGAIAARIAAKYNLKVASLPDVINVAIDRVTQKQETDLAFLRRIANEHNYDFNVRGDLLVFYSRPALEKTTPVQAIARKDLTKFSFKARTQQTYKACEVRWLNPATKKLIVGTATDPNVATGDTLKLEDRADTVQLATLKAQGALHSHNMIQTTATLTLPGTVAIRASKNVILSGFGRYDGTYHVDKSHHHLERSSGYTTEIDVRKVA